MSKIIIEIKDGMVQGAWSTNIEDDLIINDLDCIKEEDCEPITKDMKKIY